MWWMIVTDLLISVFTGCGFYFVALIVFLRLLAVRHPTNFEQPHEKVSRRGSRIIWAFVSIKNLFPFILKMLNYYKFTDRPKLYNYVHVTAFHITRTVPMLLTIVLYIMLVCTLNQKNPTNAAVSRRKRDLYRMVKGVVICMVVFNVPYIALWQYAHVVGWPKVLKSFWMVKYFN